MHLIYRSSNETTKSTGEKDLVQLKDCSCSCGILGMYQYDYLSCWKRPFDSSLGLISMFSVDTMMNMGIRPECVHCWIKASEILYEHLERDDKQMHEV